MKLTIFLTGIISGLGLTGMGQFFPPELLFWTDTITFENQHSRDEIDTSLSNNIWQAGIPSKPVINVAYEGIRAMVTDTVYPYDTNNYSVFYLSFPHDVFDGLELTFWHWFESEENYDGCYVEGSHKDDSNFYNVVEWYGYAYDFWFNIFLEDFYSTDDTIINGHYAFSGHSGTWIKSSIYFLPFTPIKNSADQGIGLNVISDTTAYYTVRFRFVFQSDSISNDLDGWAIDKIIFSRYRMPSDIEDLGNIGKGVLYPNPCSDILNILSEQAFDYLKIYDIKGQCVYRYSGYLNQINLVDLLPGIYTLSLYKDKELMYTGQFVKSKIQ